MTLFVITEGVLGVTVTIDYCSVILCGRNCIDCIICTTALLALSAPSESESLPLLSFFVVGLLTKPTGFLANFLVCCVKVGTSQLLVWGIGGIHRTDG